ncbi:MAG: hypothetical protein ACI4JF_03430 [Oscillospiraceae bacterium]
MASVSFMKLHTAQDVKRVLRHCDLEYRLQDEHANPDIDKARTSKNTQSWSYEEACAQYDERIAELDNATNANKRKDRVTAFSLEIPIPADIKDKLQFTVDVHDLLTNRFGYENLVCCYYHQDETHKYIDSEKEYERTSLEHIHFVVVPEVNGKLNGKEFSSKKNMKAVNVEIDKMSREKYGVRFLTGEYNKEQSVKSVESLKNDSRVLELQQQLKKEYNKKLSANISKEQELESKEEYLQKSEIVVKRKFKALENKEKELDEKEEYLQKKEKELQTLENNLQDEVTKRVNARLALQNKAENAYKKNTQAKYREIPDL